MVDRRLIFKTIWSIIEDSLQLSRSFLQKRTHSTIDVKLEKVTDPLRKIYYTTWLLQVLKDKDRIWRIWRTSVGKTEGNVLKSERPLNQLHLTRPYYMINRSIVIVPRWLSAGPAASFPLAFHDRIRRWCCIFRPLLTDTHDVYASNEGEWKREGGALCSAVWPTGILRCRFLSNSERSKASKFQPKMFFSLNKRFSKASKSIYLFNNERASWILMLKNSISAYWQVGHPGIALYSINIPPPLPLPSLPPPSKSLVLPLLPRQKCEEPFR